MIRFTGGLIALAAFLPAPVFAQDAEGEPVEEAKSEQDELTEKLLADDDEDNADEPSFDEILANLIEVPELTEEQKASLPTARKVVDATLPEGAYGKMLETAMGSIFDGILGEFITGSMSAMELSSFLGVPEESIDELTVEEQERLTVLIDPDYSNRSQRHMDVVTGSMGKMFEGMEPALKEGYVNAYATRFSQKQLQDILTFFGTETGKKFAAESFELQADPHVIKGTMSGMSGFEEMFAGLDSEIEAINEEFPEEKTFDVLKADERQEIADILSIPVLKLEMDMRSAEEQKKAEEEEAATAVERDDDDNIIDEAGEVLEEI